MADIDPGWAWFDDAHRPAGADVAGGVDQRLLSAFARCFQTEDGRRVMQHLRSMTLDRVLGPYGSDSLLRCAEGQRQLVAYIAALVERGGGKHDSAKRDAKS